MVDYKNDTVFTKEHSYGRVFKIIPYKDMSQLTLKWYLNSTASEWGQKSSEYIGSLFGSEGPNSLQSYLIKEGLASKISAGVGLIYANTYDNVILEI